METAIVPWSMNHLPSLEELEATIPISTKEQKAEWLRCMTKGILTAQKPLQEHLQQCYRYQRHLNDWLSQIHDERRKHGLKILGKVTREAVILEEILASK
jgi:hypothetical protein